MFQTLGQTLLGISTELHIVHRLQGNDDIRIDSIAKGFSISVFSPNKMTPKLNPYTQNPKKFWKLTQNPHAKHPKSINMSEKPEPAKLRRNTK